MNQIAILLAFFAASTLSAADKLTCASLSTVLSDLARNVGGENVEVINIVDPDVDPHGFSPSPGDIKAVTSAKVVLASGLGFETYLGKIRNSLEPGQTMVVVGDSVEPIEAAEADDHGHSHSHGGAEKDPHWWHSIANLKLAAKAIRDAFAKADPTHAAAYEANTAAYLAKLDDLAKWVKLEVAKIPKDKRYLVTSHDALGYFAKDYGFEVLPVQGISTADQPSSKKVRELIEVIRGKGITAIFAENIENPKVLEEITKETGAKPGGTLFADGLGATEAATCEAMIRHNVSTIVSALAP
jgi:zinc/manganese transport system substrate-binding protein